MAYLSPTMAAKRDNRSGEGVRRNCSFIHWLSLSRRCRAVEAIVDRLAQAVMRHLHYRDALRTGSVERAQMREQVGCGLYQVPAWRQIKHWTGKIRRRTESEQGLARPSAIGPETQQRLWGVMRSQHAWRRWRLFICRDQRQWGAENPLDGFAREPAGPQQCRRAGTGNDRRLQADLAGPRVDDEIDPTAQVGEHMRGACR